MPAPPADHAQLSAERPFQPAWTSEADPAVQPANIAILDKSGRITIVNQAWLTFAADNIVGSSPAIGPGTDYLAVCRDAAATDAESMRAFLGISSVLDGTLPQFTLEYACHSPTEQRWFLMTVASLSRTGNGGAIVSHQNITLLKQADDDRRASDKRFRAMFENAAVGIAEIAPNGQWLRVNDRLARMTGYSASVLRTMTWFDITHPADIDADRAHFEVIRSGGIDSYSVEKRFLHPDKTEIWASVTTSCVRTANGGIDYFIAVVSDISERKRAEYVRHTLLLELAHRGKNLLAVIQSIASRSLSGERTLPDARQAFSGRLHALSRTYDALTNEAFDGAPLDKILRNELGAFGARAQLDGPNIVLTVKAAQTFALVTHELATNAAKYGGLSVPDGQVFLTWGIAGLPGQQQFQFDWREAGGPPAVAPTHTGFGTTLIARVAGTEFNCKPLLEYTQSGFRYRLTAPMERFGSIIIESPVRRKIKSEIVRSLYDTWSHRQDVDRALPALSGFDWSRFAATGALTIAVVEDDNTVRFVQVGHALIEQLGRPLQVRDHTDEDPDGLIQAYQRCARQAQPTHELLRFDFGDGDPLTFERLLVPLSAAGDNVVTHLVGIVVYDGYTN